MTRSASDPLEGGATHKPLPMSAYEELRAEAARRGFFARTYGFYAFIAGTALAGMCASLYALSLTDDLLFQALNGLVFGFFSVQIGMVGHDLSHGAVFASKKANRAAAMLVWSFLGGLSERRWFHKHNEHHKGPNHMGQDPDLQIPFVFSHEQAAERSDFYKKRIFPHQHIYFWIALSFVYPYNVAHSMRHWYRNPDAQSLLELLLILAHFVIVVGLPFYLLPPLSAALFLAVAFLVIGFYMGMVFAPNHKGEEVLGRDAEFNWTHQITLTRNIYPAWATFYIFGGLDFQIEHHLFPMMSRYRYWDVRALVQELCRREGLRYHQTTWLGSMREIHQSLKEEAASWR